MAGTGEGDDPKQLTARVRRAEQQAREAERLRKEAVLARRVSEAQLRAAVREQKAREAQRRQHEALVRSRTIEARKQTTTIERRVAALSSILRDGLRRPARVPFAELRQVVDVAPLDLGDLEEPIRPQPWAAFEPAPPGRLARLFGAQSRYEYDLRRKRTDWERHEVECGDRERDRRQQVALREAEHRAAVERATAEVDRHNAGLVDLERRVAKGDEAAVRTYLTGALLHLPLPDDVPRGAEVVVRAGAGEVEVRPMLPPPDVVPAVERYTVFTKTARESAVPRSAADVAALHRDVVGQIVLLALRCVFGSAVSVQSVTIDDGRDLLRVPRSGFPPDGRLHDIDAPAFLDPFRA